MSERQQRAHVSTPTAAAARGLTPALERNIEAVIERRHRDASAAPLEERVAARISRFAGSMLFVYIHLVVFAGWIVINAGTVPLLPRWDPSLVVLAMIASVEAIFLSAFVLINQNRMAVNDDLRADLDLQINLLNEHETTRLITMVDLIAKHLGIETDVDGELAELKRDVAPEAVLDKIEATS